MFIKTFKQIDKNDVMMAGGKGASLGEMTQAKMPVPPGFVVVSSAFDKFVEETGLDIEIEAALGKINYKDINSVDRYSNVIRDMIKDAKFPKDVGQEVLKEFDKLKAKYIAVRSSATAEDSSVASWAGELESYLNVTRKDLLKYVKECWSSLFTPRAIFYRFEKNLQDQKVSVAVVVQKMVQSEVSGITFTAHPVTKDLSQMVIEAGYGLGEAIVGGKVTPDTYIIDKNDLVLLDVNISQQEMMISKDSKNVTKEMAVPKTKQEKQKLPNQQILKLAKICKEIEEHYQHPQDIEWALDNNRLYITQSRPITTL